MMEWIHSHLGNLIIRFQIVLRIEFRDRAERAKSVREIVRQRIRTGRHLVLGTVPDGIEQRTGPAALRLAGYRVVKQRLHIRLGNVVVFREIPQRLENRIWLLSPTKALEKEVFEKREIRL